MSAKRGAKVRWSVRCLRVQTKERPRPGLLEKSSPDAVQGDRTCPDQKTGRPGVCLRVPCDAPNLERIAP